MPMMEGFGNALRTMRVYLLGRGLISLGVIAATMASSAFTGFTILGVAPALIFAVGGTALSGFMRIRAQGRYEQNMVDLYRDDIANQLGIQPSEVARGHLKQAAEGNEIIAQALHRQERKNTVAFATAALAGIATFGLIGFAATPDLLTHYLTNTLSLGATAAKVLSFASAGLVAGVSSLVVHDGLEAAIGHGTGLSKAAAHDLIFAMNRDVGQGRSISPEQVYGVLVAGDTSLQAAISKQFRKSYHDMNAREQRNVMRTIGVSETMQLLANEITKGSIEAGHLAFIIGDARKLDVPVTPVVEQATAPALGQFVERLSLAPRAQKTFAARISEPVTQSHSPSL